MSYEKYLSSAALGAGLLPVVAILVTGASAHETQAVTLQIRLTWLLFLNH